MKEDITGLLASTTMSSPKCEHRPEWIRKRDDDEIYCTVCRIVLDVSDFKILPDSIREREVIRKGRAPNHPLSRALLNGSTVFIAGPPRSWGSIYNLAKNHGKRARVKRTEVNREKGTLVWFEDLPG